MRRLEEIACRILFDVKESVLVDRVDCPPVILILGRKRGQKQEDHEFKASLGYIWDPPSENKQTFRKNPQEWTKQSIHLKNNSKRQFLKSVMMVSWLCFPKECLSVPSTYWGTYRWHNMKVVEFALKLSRAGALDGIEMRQDWPWLSWELIIVMSLL